MSIPSPHPTSSALRVGPPECMRRGSETANDVARALIANKRKRFSLRRIWSKDKDRPTESPTTSISENEDALDSAAQNLPGDTVRLISSRTTGEVPGQDKDVYRWAIVYENQRGMTVFSMPYYSRLSLLPNDPPAFTIPEARGGKDRQPQISLEEYPLPDGTWRWVSRSWMIDMRGDGEVQYDGFEYNWFFRARHWRAEVGKFSAGALVRRRRWLRLMVKPAVGQHALTHEATAAHGTDATARSEDDALTPSSHGAHPPSVLDAITIDMEERWRFIWNGNDPESDWQECHALMKHLGRDGRKLEVWRAWLTDHREEGSDEPASGVFATKTRRKQWTEDETPIPYESDHASTGRESISTDRDRISAALCAHGHEILGFFVYPESRAQFLQMLKEVGLLAELQESLGISRDGDMLEFWSYGPKDD